MQATCLVDGPKGGKLSRFHRTQEQCESDFWERVNKGDPDECWPWAGGTNNGLRVGIGSYGIVWFNGKKHKAHRYSFEISVRKLKPGELVCHGCDTPICCNPNHLFAGSNLDNMRDMILKGRERYERGEDRYNATLTEKDVREIRYLYQNRKAGGMVAKKLAKIYGVSRSMIYSIVNRERWKHVA